MDQIFVFQMTTSGSYAIGVDVGTGSVRCMIFDDRWTPVVQCQKAIRVSDRF